MGKLAVLQLKVVVSVLLLLHCMPTERKAVCGSEYPEVESGKKEKSLHTTTKCIGNLRDIKEAFFTPDPSSDKTEVVRNFFAMKGRFFKKRNGLTMGFYRLTQVSEQPAAKSTLSDVTSNITSSTKVVANSMQESGNLEETGNEFQSSKFEVDPPALRYSAGNCCFPNSNNTRCLIVIVFHSVAYQLYHPMLLNLFAYPLSPRQLFADGGQHKVAIDLTLTSQVVCWSLPPVCDNISASIADSLSSFTLQFDDLLMYGEFEGKTSNPIMYASYNVPNKSCYIRSCYIKVITNVVLAGLMFISGPTSVMLMNRHWAPIHKVVSHSSFARWLLHASMLASSIFALYMYCSLVLAMYFFTTTMHSSQRYFPLYWWSDIVAGVSDIAVLTAIVIFQYPFIFYSFWTMNSRKPLHSTSSFLGVNGRCHFSVRVITAMGWSSNIVFVQVLSFYSFHNCIFLLVSPVATLVRICLLVCSYLSSVIGLSIFIRLCHKPNCSLARAVKILVVLTIISVVNCSLLCLQVIKDGQMSPGTVGVSTDGIILSASASAIVSCFVYFIKVITIKRISSDIKDSEMQSLIDKA